MFMLCPATIVGFVVPNVTEPLEPPDEFEVTFTASVLQPPEDAQTVRESEPALEP